MNEFSGRKEKTIVVNGKRYPLFFKGKRLCSDLKYRSKEVGLGWSGPDSAFNSNG